MANIGTEEEGYEIFLPEREVIVLPEETPAPAEPVEVPVPAEAPVPIP